MAVRVNATDPDPLILSLRFDAVTFEALDGLRRHWFPPARNQLSAHLTLFHQLPGEQAEAIAEQLSGASAATAALPVTLPSVRFLGRGVAINVSSDGLLRLRGELARAWQPWLTPQDRQGFRPHVTVQNKVTPAEARDLYERLRQTWTPLSGVGTGLQLWWYRGGPWELAGTFPFGGPAAVHRPESRGPTPG